MAKYILPHFGQLETTQLDEYYEAEISLKDITVQVDLNFDSTQIEPARLDIAKRFIEQLPDFDFRNKKYLEQDYADESADTVRTYLEHHLDELGEEELSALIDYSIKKISPEKQLLKKLQLVRMGLYPDSEDQFAIFDYSIGPELTQYLVVIFTDESGNPEYITMES